MNAAKYCRENGFKPGDYLRITLDHLVADGVGFNHRDDVRIVKLTAIGESAILARRRGSCEATYFEAESIERVGKFAGRSLEGKCG